MFCSRAMNLCLKFAVFMLLPTMLAVSNGCDEGYVPVSEPGTEEKVPADNPPSAGELHNMIVRGYLSAVLSSGRLDETGGRIPWQEARMIFLSVGNDILEERNADLRLTEELLDNSLRQLVSMKQKGVIDVFYPERNERFPELLNGMAEAGFLSHDRAERIGSFWNESVELSDGGPARFSGPAGDFKTEDENVLSVIEYSDRFWGAVTGEYLVGKENEEEESDDSFWDDLHDWWIRNRKDIRRIAITSCDAGGAVVGSGLGPAGVVAGSMLASTGATIAWPPYDEIEIPGGGDLNCRTE